MLPSDDALVQVLDNRKGATLTSDGGDDVLRNVATAWVDVVVDSLVEWVESGDGHVWAGLLMSLQDFRSG